MRILFNLIYFIVFLILAVIAMFVGGVSGAAGTFYLMVEEGNIEENLTMAIGILSVLWLLLMILRSQNKKVIKRNRLREQDAAEKE